MNPPSLITILMFFIGYLFGYNHDKVMSVIQYLSERYQKAQDSKPKYKKNSKPSQAESHLREVVNKNRISYNTNYYKGNSRGYGYGYI